MPKTLIAPSTHSGHSEQRNLKQKLLRRKQRELETWQSEISLEYQRYKGEGRLVAERYKNQLNFSNKITTAANAHLKEFLLGNWLKTNHITVDIIIIFCFGLACLYLGSFTSFRFQTYFSTAETPFSFLASKVQNTAF